MADYKSRDGILKEARKRLTELSDLIIIDSAKRTDEARWPFGHEAFSKIGQVHILLDLIEQRTETKHE